MQEDRNTLTTSGMTLPHVILILVSIGMVGVGLYLTNHYFDTIYPSTFSSKSLCDINSFFSCDAATYSPISNVFSVPIAIFGSLMGVFFLIGSIFPSRDYEQTNRLMSLVNFALCVLLFLYSLVVLGSLCPFCTLYYVLSGIAAGLFWFYGIKQMKVAPGVVGVMTGLSVIVFASFFFVMQQKNKEQVGLKTSILKQFHELPKLPLPTPSSQQLLEKGPGAFSDAPIQLTIFSDFQCPSCKALSEQVPKIVKRYKGKVAVQYYFFPLDNACNKLIPSPAHPLACQLSYLAICSKDKFVEVHDEIFEQQGNHTTEWIQKKARELGAEICMAAPETKALVESYVVASEPLKVKSTPTYMINGVKIEGVLPLNQVFMIMDDLVK